MRNELRLGANDQWFNLDVIEDIDIAITKSVYNISDPSKRNSDFTKTIEIPGSKNNDAIFRSLFDVNFSIRNDAQLAPDFNPTKKADCIYYQDSIEQINGYLQLKEIILEKEDKVTYSVVIQGKNADIYSKLANKTLNDLQTLGVMTWDDIEIKSQWNALVPQDQIVYPMLNRGKEFDWICGGYINDVGYDYNAFKPWIKVKALMDAVIREAGFKYQSDFFASDHFNRLILECDNKNFTLNQALVDAKKVNVNKTSSQVITPCVNSDINNASVLWNKQIIYNVEVTDPSGQFDPATGTFTMDNETYTNLRIQVAGEMTNTQTLTSVNDVTINFVVVLLRGATYKILGGFDAIAAPNSISIGSTTTYGFTSNVVYEKLKNIKLLVGDQVRVCVNSFKQLSQFINDKVEINPNPSNIYTNSFLQYVNGQITYGTETPVNVIQYNMKQTEFFMGIVKLFNLFIEPQKDGTLVIEPRDDFFLNDTINWTRKLDTGQEFKILPQGLLENKQINFNYELNGDDNSQLFYNSVGYNPGYKRKIFDNEFVKEVKEVKVPFALPPLDTYDGRIMMRTLFQGVGSEDGGKPIIAYYNWIDCASSPWVYYDNGTCPRTANSYTEYPYAGHFDNVLNPQYDLCFDEQPFYFFLTPGASGITTTTANLYNLYHYRQWEEIGDKDSKLVEAYFNLNSLDIGTLSFRNIYWVRDAAYRLLEVEDYRPNQSEVTKCLLLKLNIVNALERVQNTVSGNGGGNGGIGGGEILMLNKGGDTSTPGDTAYGRYRSGSENTMGPNSKGIVVGSNNYVGSNVKGFIIRGNDNVIADGLQNVTIINSNGNVVNESNTTIIGGLTTANIPDGSGVRYTSDWATANDYTIPTELTVKTRQLTIGEVTVTVLTTD